MSVISQSQTAKLKSIHNMSEKADAAVYESSDERWCRAHKPAPGLSAQSLCRYSQQASSDAALLKWGGGHRPSCCRCLYGSKLIWWYVHHHTCTANQTILVPAGLSQHHADSPPWTNWHLGILCLIVYHTFILYVRCWCCIDFAPCKWTKLQEKCATSWCFCAHAGIYL